MVRFLYLIQVRLESFGLDLHLRLKGHFSRASMNPSCIRINRRLIDVSLLDLFLTLHLSTSSQNVFLPSKKNFFLESAYSIAGDSIAIAVTYLFLIVKYQKYIHADKDLEGDHDLTIIQMAYLPYPIQPSIVCIEEKAYG